MLQPIKLPSQNKGDLMWNFTLSSSWAVTEQSKFVVPASLESEVAVVYRDDKKLTSQKRISPVGLASTVTTTKEKKETGTCSQAGEDTRTKTGQLFCQQQTASELEKGLFTLLNWLSDLKW